MLCSCPKFQPRPALRRSRSFLVFACISGAGTLTRRHGSPCPYISWRSHVRHSSMMKKMVPKMMMATIWGHHPGNRLRRSSRGTRIRPTAERIWKAHCEGPVRFWSSSGSRLPSPLSPLLPIIASQQVRRPCQSDACRSGEEQGRGQRSRNGTEEPERGEARAEEVEEQRVQVVARGRVRRLEVRVRLTRSAW